jgi:hypothetical protein
MMSNRHTITIQPKIAAVNAFLAVLPVNEFVFFSFLMIIFIKITW